jgi:hypothetical protein
VAGVDYEAPAAPDLLNELHAAAVADLVTTHRQGNQERQALEERTGKLDERLRVQSATSAPRSDVAETLRALERMGLRLDNQVPRQEPIDGTAEEEDEPPELPPAAFGARFRSGVPGWVARGWQRASVLPNPMIPLSSFDSSLWLEFE